MLDELIGAQDAINGDEHSIPPTGNRGPAGDDRAQITDGAGAIEHVFNLKSFIDEELEIALELAEEMVPWLFQIIGAVTLGVAAADTKNQTIVVAFHCRDDQPTGLQCPAKL